MEFTASSSSLTSCSVEASVQFYEKRLKPGIEAIRKSGIPLLELVDASEKIVHEQFAPDPRSTFRLYTKNENDSDANSAEELSVQLHKIMLAMLACVEECGGKSGKEYIAAAILACTGEEDVVGALEALGTTWFTHLLFVFKTRRGDENQVSFADVKARDGYTCVLTGFQDRSHPKPMEGARKLRLSCARILPKVLGGFDDDPTSKSFKSATTTFDILLNFARLPFQTLEELKNRLDGPSNGMTLERNARDAFNNMYWSLKKPAEAGSVRTREEVHSRLKLELDGPSNGVALQRDARDAFDNLYGCLIMKPTDTQHVYDLKIFDDLGILRKPEDDRIAFQDHSSHTLLDSTRKSNKVMINNPVALPDPHFIAIHAAIAEILDMSGAGKFFDELFSRYRDNEGCVPNARSWLELEALMERVLIRESVAEMFRSAVISREH